MCNLEKISASKSQQRLIDESIVIVTSENEK